MFSHLVLWGNKSKPADGTFVYCQLASSVINNSRPATQPSDGTFTYCQLQTTLITNWRPATQPSDGTFTYCSQDINQFNRTP